MDDARQAAERVARTSYGRLVALIAARTGDIAAAEDALAGAFQAALQSWPERGLPDRPEAWLMTAARRSLGHDRRHEAVRTRSEDVLTMLHDEARERPDFPDDRLKLLFVCAHPAIDEAARTPLMLQTVLGLDAARIAAAFLTAPVAMGQRLVRAKAKIKAAGVRFAEPHADQLAERLEPVLGAIYAAYGTAWDATPGAQDKDGLADEAIYLARLLVALLPTEPEAKGLLALMLYCEARAAARRDAQGAYVALADQDPALWSRTMIVEAEALLTEAARAHRFGRFQTEAAIQSLHVTGRAAGRIDREALVALYDVLIDHAPTIGVKVARAAAVAEYRGPVAGLEALDQIAGAESYQPAWALHGHLLRSLDREEAAPAFQRAIGLSQNEAVRSFLRSRMDQQIG